MIGNKSKLEKWMEIPAKLKTKSNGSVVGKVKYGIRIPCAGGMTPLKEVELGSKEKVNREGADYWFVNDTQYVKVRLLTARTTDSEITGYGLDVSIFKYKITKLDN